MFDNNNRDFGQDEYYVDSRVVDDDTDNNSSRRMNRAQRRAFRRSGRNQRPKRKMNVFSKTACCGLIIGGIAGGMVLGSFALGNNIFGNSSSDASLSTTTSSLKASDASTSSGSSSSSSSDYTVSEIADKCTSSVVAITNKSVSETQSMFGNSGETESAGSGVIVGKNKTELLIATNYHVIEDADSLTVCFNDSKSEVYKASVKGTDSDNDLAVIAVKLSSLSSNTLKKITVATIADSSSEKVGDQVVAIGNALGSGQSVTSGYISALNKKVTESNGTTASLLQTDAAINPGNSGGALFNMKGELIAINTAKYSDTSVEGMGFAIPMSKAEPIIQKLMTQTTKTRLSSGYGYLGIAGSDVDSETSSSYNLPEGVYVSQVSSGSCAARAGIQNGDIITRFDGQSISSMSDLKSLLKYYKAGTAVKVTIARNTNGSYKTKKLTVTLDNANNASSGSSSSSSGSSSGSQYYSSDGDSDSSSQYGSGSGSDSEDSSSWDSILNGIFGN